MSAAVYSEEVRRRCHDLSRAGAWPEDDPAVGTGQAGSLDAGALTRIQLHVAGDGIDDARFKVFGCSAAIACASLAADRVVGASLSGARGFDAAVLADTLALPSDKRAMAVLAADAVRAAVADWERKSGDRRPGTRDQARTSR